MSEEQKHQDDDIKLYLPAKGRTVAVSKRLPSLSEQDKDYTGDGGVEWARSREGLSRRLHQRHRDRRH